MPLSRKNVDEYLEQFGRPLRALCIDPALYAGETMGLIEPTCLDDQGFFGPPAETPHCRARYLGERDRTNIATLVAFGESFAYYTTPDVYLGATPNPDGWQLFIELRFPGNLAFKAKKEERVPADGVFAALNEIVSAFGDESAKHLN